MKIPRDRYRVLKYFGVLFGMVFYSCLMVIMEAPNDIKLWVLLLVLTVACALLAVGYDRLSYAGRGLEFDASGVMEYGSFGLTRHHKWEEYKFRCVTSDHGERERFYFSRDRLQNHHFSDVRYLYHPPKRPRGWQGFESSIVGISVSYTQERYEAFRASCPNVELFRIDSEGSVYYITASEAEILIAEPKASAKYLTMPELRKGVEALAASGFPDIAGILNATGLQLSEEAMAKADAAVKTEVHAQAETEEIHASAERDSADEAVEALRASTAVFVDEDSEVDEDYEYEFAEDEFSDEEYEVEDE